MSAAEVTVTEGARERERIAEGGEGGKRQSLWLYSRERVSSNFLGSRGKGSALCSC